MSDEKTLGQVYSEAMDDAKDMRGVVTWADRYAAGIAAVARHIIDEAMAKHEKECHRLRPPTVKVDDDEPAKPVSPTSGTINTGPIIACDVKQEAASKAGDWAMGFLLGGRSLHELSDADQQRYVKKASGLREAAERHYGPIVNELALQRGSTIERLIEERDVAIQERDASRGEWSILMAESGEQLDRHKTAMVEYESAMRDWKEKIVDERDRQCNVATAAIRNRDEAQKERDAAHAANKSIQAHNAELVKERDAARADVERLKEALELEQADRRYRNAPPSPAADATGEDELRKAVEAVLHGYSVYGATDFLSLKVIAAVRPLFDAVLAERDEAIKAVECHKSYHDTEQAIKRAETAESERDKLVAELQELQEAVIASPPMSLRHTTTGTPYWTYTGAELTHPNNLSAILAAFRATKGKEQGDGPK